jgi:hypothetical protein
MFNDKGLDSSVVDKAIEWKIKILKATSSLKFMMFTIVASYLLFVFAFFIPLIPNNFECTFGTLTAIKIIHNALLIVVFILSIIVCCRYHWALQIGNQMSSLQVRISRSILLSSANSLVYSIHVVQSDHRGLHSRYND